MELKDFVDGSRTFNGFEFSGIYCMNKDIFFKLFDHYLKTGENYLDAYSELKYLTWEMTSSQKSQHDFIECEKYESHLSIARKLKLIGVDERSEIRNYIRKCWYDYRDYLDRKRNEPRRKACRFTALAEVKKYVFGRYGKKCLCCGSLEKISLDHVIPINKGGRDDVDNLQPLCKACNSRKNVQIIDYR